MKPNRKQLAAISTAAAAVLLAALGTPAAAWAAGWKSSNGESARDTLKDIRVHARAGAEDAYELKAMIANPRYSADSHMVRLNELRAEVNQMGKDIVKLNGERTSLPVWEQQAVDRVLPLVQDAAKNTSNAIHCYNTATNRLWGPEDSSYAEHVYRDADKIASTLGDYLTYERLQDEESAVQAHIAASDASGGN